MSTQAYDYLTAPTPSTYQTGRGMLFSERHMKELNQRHLRYRINEVLSAIQQDPAFDSHAEHFEFLYREYDYATTPERRASVKAQVDHYARLLAEYQTAGAPVPRVTTPPPSPTSLSAPEAIYETPERPTVIPADPPAPPRLKKAGTLPLSPPPTPKLLAMNAVIRSKSGNLSTEDFECGMEYMIYRLEMAGAPVAKLAAYVELYEFFMDQPIVMMKSPELRSTALAHLQATREDLAPTNEILESLEQRFTNFLQSLRVHPYYVA